MRHKLLYLIAIATLVMAAPTSHAKWEQKDKTKKDENPLQRRTGTRRLERAQRRRAADARRELGQLWLLAGLGEHVLRSAFLRNGRRAAVSSIFFTSGLWVGALKSGIPAVTTAAFATEFRPTQDPVDIIYRAAEGARGGNRLPSPDADDDKDGLVDEDWLNGRDDDNDGLIDEDFAAVSKQMFQLLVHR